MSRLVWLCQRLDAARIFHEVGKYRDDAISIRAAVPGERWEIDVDRSGAVTIARFRALGEVSGLDQFDALLETLKTGDFQ